MSACATSAATETARIFVTPLPTASSVGLASKSSLAPLVRHGPGDAVIVLNVGGTEFVTLRSTVQANAVLADHVARAEANGEQMQNGAVFVDRDPTHFAFILQFLRNRVEMITYGATSVASSRTPISMKQLTETYVQLPKDPVVLRDLYVEATYYRIPELQDKLKKAGWLFQVVDLLTDGANPFDMAAKWMGRLRVLLLTFGTVGGLGGGLRWFGSLQNTNDDDDSEHDADSPIEARGNSSSSSSSSPAPPQQQKQLQEQIQTLQHVLEQAAAAFDDPGE